jgi:hypothetical protein
LRHRYSQTPCEGGARKQITDVPGLHESNLLFGC